MAHVCHDDSNPSQRQAILRGFPDRIIDLVPHLVNLIHAGLAEPHVKMARNKYWSVRMSFYHLVALGRYPTCFQVDPIAPQRPDPNKKG
jgi:hypothetical protein